MDLSTVCRLCCSRVSKKSRDIFDTPNLLDEISRFTDIKINREENLAKKICHLCYAKVKKIENFRRQVNRADAKMRKSVDPKCEMSLKEEPTTIVDDTESVIARVNYNDFENSVDSNLKRNSLMEGYDEDSIVRSTESSGFKQDFEKIKPSAPSSSDGVSSDDIIEDNLMKNIFDNSFPSDWLSRLRDNNRGILVADPLNLLKVKSIEPIRNPLSPIGGNCGGTNSSSSSSLKLIDNRRGKKNSMRLSKSDLSIRNVKLNRDNDNVDGGNDIEKNSFKRSKKFYVECPICNKICANSHGVKIHLGCVHRSRKCTLCGASTPTKEKFNDHMRLHVSSRKKKLIGKKVQCDICKNIFKNKAGLSIHIRSHMDSLPG